MLILKTQNSKLKTAAPLYNFYIFTFSHSYIAVSVRPKALRLRIDGIGLRIALVHMVLAMLHNLDTLEESLDTVGGGGVLGRRRHEEYPHSLDVGIRTELLGGFCRGGADAHLEGAQSVELHLLATSQVLVDIVQERCHACAR